MEYPPFLLQNHYFSENVLKIRVAFCAKTSNIYITQACVSGLGNAHNLIEKIKSGEEHFDFVEVMACPGGCSGGGGQPIHEGEELAEERASVLYQLDRKAPMRFSHENPAIRKLYEDFLGKPLSAKAEALLHTDHESWQMPGRKS